MVIRWERRTTPITALIVHTASTTVAVVVAARLLRRCIDENGDGMRMIRRIDVFTR